MTNSRGGGERGQICKEVIINVNNNVSLDLRKCDVGKE